MQGARRPAERLRGETVVHVLWQAHPQCGRAVQGHCRIGKPKPLRVWT